MGAGLLVEQKSGSKYFLKLNFDFTSFRNPFPDNLSKYVTPRELSKAGFKKIDKIRYSKKFSDVLELRVTLSKKSGKSYDWILDEEKLKYMVNDLRAIKEYLDRKSLGIFTRWFEKGQRSKKRGIRKGYWREMLAGMNRAHKMKKDFSEKYKEFFDIARDIKMRTPYYREKYFFFDACKTTRQLHLFFEFIELCLDVFGELRKSKPYTRKISADAIKEAIVSYYVLLFTIKKVRRLYQTDISFDELKNRFPMINEGILEDITLDVKGKKGWAYKASDFALDYASWTANTTPQNLKQILKQEKIFVLEIKKQVSNMKEVEKALAGKIGVLADPLRELNIEKAPAEDWVGLIRWTLSHFGPIDENKLPSFLKR